MNKLYIIFISCLLPILLFAQKKKKENYFLQSVENVAVDGDLTEWNESLFNKDSDVWSFSLAINEGKLYTAIRIKNEQLQSEALRSGIFVNLSYTNKKKEGARLFYPVLDREKLRAFSQDEDFDLNNYKQDFIEATRGYYILGFSRVVDGLLSFDNDYGIRAVVKIDSTDALIYESEIPLDLIKFEKDNIAINLGVNTRYLQMKRAGRNTNQVPMNVRIYGRMPSAPTVKNPYQEETDVWITGSIN